MARIFLILALFATAYAQNGYNLPYSPYGAPEPRNEASNIVTSYNSPDNRAEVEDPIAVLASIIPGGGIPGEDYPIFALVRDTGFACEDMEYPGYFADINYGCQMFHICQEDFHQDSFLCPNGTIFNQQYFVCDWWFNVDCASSPGFFRLNDEIGKVPENYIIRDTSASDLSNSYSAPSTDPVPRVPSGHYAVPLPAVPLDAGNGQYAVPLPAVPLDAGAGQYAVPLPAVPLDAGNGQYAVPLPAVPLDAGAGQYAVPLPAFPLDAGAPAPPAPSNQYAVPLPAVPLDAGAPAPPVPSNQYAVPLPGVPLDAGAAVPLPSNLYNIPNRRRSFT